MLRLLGDALERDQTICRVRLTDFMGHPGVRALVDSGWSVPHDVVAYAAAAEGPYGRFRLLAVFADLDEPVMLCLDGPSGSAASPHRNGELGLCLYEPSDPPGDRWTFANGLLALFDIARQHLVCEHLFRSGTPWPIREAPHGRRDRMTTAPAVRRGGDPGRNQPCSCGSGLKSKRCCFQ